MLQRQAGLSLITVAVLMAGLAALAMAALFSMRYERNVFAEGWNKVSGKAKGATASLPAVLAPAATPAATATASGLRQCTIHGKTVISNTECQEQGKLIDIHDSRGIEPPKAPPPPKDEAAAPTAQERQIDKATR
jgi:hypothetical protein